MCQPLTAEGEFALVREHLEIALLQPSVGWIAFGDHELYNLLVDIAVLQRDEAVIQKYAPHAEAFASRYDHKLYQAVAHRARGVLHCLAGENEKAESSLKQALDIFSAMNTHYQIGRTLFELGELAIGQSNLSEARHYFNRSLSAFVAMRAVPDVARARDRITAL